MDGVSEREFDVVVIGMGPGAEYVAEELAQGGRAGGRRRGSPGRRRVPVLGLHPVEDDDQGGQPADRRPPHLRHGGLRPSSRPAGRRSPSGSGMRQPTTGTTRWPPTASPTSAGRCSAGMPGSPRPARSPSATTCCGPGAGIVIGTGTAPAIPPIDGLAQTPYWTNHEAIESEDVPRSLLILGGGAIGTELAQVFARFGTRGDRDRGDAGGCCRSRSRRRASCSSEVFRAEDITVSTGTGAESVRHDGARVHRDARGRQAAPRGRGCWWRPGARPTWPALGVGAIGLDETARFIAVDDADAGRARRLGARRRRRQGRLHAHVHVPRPHHPRRPARPSAPSGRVSRGAAGHVH